MLPFRRNPGPTAETTHPDSKRCKLLRGYIKKAVLLGV
jgi:hypothetical protein